jgi:Fe-S-cluster-containing hydrogenase component 2
MKRIKVKNPERCIGCMGCVFACARTRYDSISMDRSAIHVETVGGIESEFAIIACRMCEDPPCVASCPTDAIENRNGNLHFDARKCDGCKKCIGACLIGAIYFDEELNNPLICIQCGVCAKFCPHDVLELERLEAI